MLHAEAIVGTGVPAEEIRRVHGSAAPGVQIDGVWRVLEKRAGSAPLRASGDTPPRSFDDVDGADVARALHTLFVPEMPMPSVSVIGTSSSVRLVGELGGGVFVDSLRRVCVAAEVRVGVAERHEEDGGEAVTGAAVSVGGANVWAVPFCGIGWVAALFSPRCSSLCRGPPGSRKHFPL
jgi:hypothetical protein